MSDLIINLPHLQSMRQRLGSYTVTVACWLLWLYFLAPIITLGGWLLGVRKLSKEIRWFGGYKSLQELMVMYGETILAIALLWLCWTMLLSLRRKQPNTQPEPVGPEALCRHFNVPGEAWQTCQASRRVTVHFDEHGQIVRMLSDLPGH
jgi:poly-beta-1,6-N-acetyl-D-glucosamine biosynthesis protein PgaD